MKTTTERLLQALAILGKIFPTQAGEDVTAIQFEDGSGTKFNYQINSGKWLYVDLESFF